MALAPTAAVTTAPAARTVGDRARSVVGLASHKLTRDELVRDMKIGVAFQAPFEGVIEGQAYRKGEIKANEYVARVIANSLGFATWTLGGATAAALLAPIGAPAFLLAAAGFAGGMIANDLFDRTFGAAMVKVLKDTLPEAACKPFADKFVKYVSNPLTDYVWKPVSGFVMKHKIISGVALGVLALRFPSAGKAVGREVGAMAIGTAAALGLQFGVLDRFMPAAEHRK